MRAQTLNVPTLSCLALGGWLATRADFTQHDMAILEGVASTFSLSLSVPGKASVRREAWPKAQAGGT